MRAGRSYMSVEAGRKKEAQRLKSIERGTDARQDAMKTFGSAGTARQIEYEGRRRRQQETEKQKRRRYNFDFIN